ncbi:MAG: pyridoxal-dependent decarboxylase [Actinomycetes bacterium]
METAHFGYWLKRLGDGLDRYLAFEHPNAVAVRASWDSLADEALADGARDLEDVVGELVDVVIPGGSTIASPTWWGFITTGTTTAPVLAATAAMVAGPQRYSITAFNRLEERSLEWLAELCGLEPGMKGVYSSGGSVANLVALGAARQSAFERIGIDVAATGVDRPCAIYASEEAHHTVQRSAAVLGLGRSAVRTVPTDGQQRMLPEALEELLVADQGRGVLPVAVVATAGTTNTGAIDPLRAVGEVAVRHQVWLHIDGAYGLPGRLDPRISDRYDGLDLADSAIVDPHKWLAAPVGVAATFVRDRSLLVRAFTQEPAEYLEGSFVSDDEPSEVVVSMDSIGIPYADMGVELSSPSRGVMVWALLREQGREGVRRRIMTDNDFATAVYDFANAHPRLQALTRPELSIACIRHVGDGSLDEGRLNELNQALLRRLIRETPFVPSATVVDGAFAIRPCFINVRTTRPMVDKFVETLVTLGDELAGDPKV